MLPEEDGRASIRQALTLSLTIERGTRRSFKSESVEQWRAGRGGDERVESSRTETTGVHSRDVVVVVVVAKKKVNVGLDGRAGSVMWGGGGVRQRG